MKIVIPLFLYPPYKAVGSNRWNNFSKLLSRDYKVEIWTVFRGTNYQSNNPNLKVRIFECDPLYKIYDKKFNNFFMEKLVKKLLIVFSRLFWPTDIAEHWPNFLKKEILNEIKKGSLFILTGGPFSVQSKIFKILNSYNYQKYILDFRDTWNTDPLNFYLFSFFKERAQLIEKNMLNTKDGEKIFVTKTLPQHMICEVSKYKIIKNAHDFSISNFQSFEELSKLRKNIKGVKFFYLGTLGTGRDIIFREFIEKIKNTNQEISIDIYGNVSLRIFRYINDIKTKNIKISIKNNIKRSDIINFSKNYNLGLQINSDIYPYALSTKVFEYPALAMPQISICQKGEIIELIKSNKIGDVIKPSFNSIQILKVINKTLNETKTINLYNFATDSSWEKRYGKLKLLVEKFENRCAV